VEAKDPKALASLGLKKAAGQIIGSVRENFKNLTKIDKNSHSVRLNNLNKDVFQVIHIIHNYSHSRTLSSY